jgi:hypothetical protein
VVRYHLPGEMGAHLLQAFKHHLAGLVAMPV